MLVAPLMLLIAALIRRDSSGPAFFRQARLGIDMRPFTLFKFRTMHDGTDDTPHRDYLAQIMSADATPGTNNLYKLDRADAITRVGEWLRRTSLDELPQLLNVLRGDMSLVGPRPEQVEVVDRYAEEHRLRLAVKPGLTGPMQVYGRGALTFEERLAVEREYIENLSIGRDLRLLALTLPSVVNGRGAF
jgi:lipopolysaccharide/colanic/teichoic acid biosynthesis glycosyltransferase